MTVSRELLKRLEALESRSGNRGFHVHFLENGPAEYPPNDKVVIIEFCEGLPDHYQIDAQPRTPTFEYQGDSQAVAFDIYDESDS